MANLQTKGQRTNFRYVPDINSLNESQLESHGYYLGYPCPHRHHIRDKDSHWCYHCVRKIKSNICGFNMNFLHPYYNFRYQKLWEKVSIGEPNECWDIALPGARSPKRISFPSYRSYHTQRALENVNPHKLIYQCAWGDIGSLTVSKACGNPWCVNPLHLVSSWNIGLPPATVYPFDLEFKPEYLMAISKAAQQNREDELIESYYKQTIRNPLCAPDLPYYDEG